MENEIENLKKSNISLKPEVSSSLGDGQLDE